MEYNFTFWKKRHDDASLGLFNTDTVGQLWLKLKSIVRPELIKEFINQNNFSICSTISGKQFEELFYLLSKNVASSHLLLDEYIRSKNQLILNDLDTQKLVSELYKLKVF